MRNLLNFLFAYSTWFVFAFYVLLSCLLLFSANSYQQSVFLTSANVVAGGVYGAASNVTGYFNLRDINESLQQRNASLEKEVLNLRDRITALEAVVGDTVTRAYISDRFAYQTASVINNSVRLPRNYFTINRGKADGIKTGMGVVDQNGIVGIVNVTGPHTSRVISLLNETQHLSVKIKGTQFVGTMAWRGGDPNVGYMEEVQRHVKFHVGDTIVTTGFSTTFPEGLLVGTVMNRIKNDDDNFFTLKVRFSSNFQTLSTVRVLTDEYQAELDSLTQFDYRTDK